jgi:hypothetical protein
MGLKTLISDVFQEITRQDQAPFLTLVNYYKAYRNELFSAKEIRYFNIVDNSVDPQRRSRQVSKEVCSKFWARHVCSDYRALINDKTLFEQLCRTYKLPTANTIAVYDEPAGYDHRGKLIESRDGWVEFFENEAPGEFLVKASGGYSGHGISHVSRGEKNKFTIGEQSYCTTELVDWLAEERRSMRFDLISRQANRQKFLIQKLLLPHPSIIEMTGSQTLQTIRATTYTTDDNEVHLLFIFMKIACGGRKTDHFEYGQNGNILAEIDTDTGTIGAPYRLDKDTDTLIPTDRHPDSGNPIRGFSIPYYAESLQLIEKAALVFLPQKVVGWDIAITADGPILLEGNLTWSPIVPFAMSRAKLKDIGVIVN